MIYPKPPKKKKKNGHITNKRIIDYIPCEVCGVNQAIETHEVFGGKAFRNKSIQYGAQVKICRECHKDSRVLKDLKILWQPRLMAENEWSEDDFIREFGKFQV